MYYIRYNFFYHIEINNNYYRILLGNFVENFS
jgi:hypothetical protein